jgi:hypothetical protein
VAQGEVLESELAMTADEEGNEPEHDRTSWRRPDDPSIVGAWLDLAPTSTP